MRELLALIPKTRGKLLLFLCEHKDEDKLRTLLHISQEAQLAYITTKKVLREFESLGLVKIYVVGRGRARVVVPTEKLKEVCDALAQ